MLRLRRATLLLVLFALVPKGEQDALMAQSRAKGNEEVTRLLFVFDASNSMNAFWGRRRKWDVARELLTASVDSLYGIEGLEVGLRVYGHGTKHVQGQQDCDDTELVVPISKGGNLLIKQELRKLSAQGTTPIARSLLKAADDFSKKKGPGKNVILLITDGIEACDEDPCAVSRALQAQDIIIKPFIIGIGLEEKYKDTFQCVGRYFDASSPDSFGAILDIVIDQAIHQTTAQVDLLDAEGAATATNLPFELVEHHSGQPVLQSVHTMNPAGVPDTLMLNPIPEYDLVVHSIPPVTASGLTLEPRTHNHIEVSVPTGFIELKPDLARSELLDIPVTVRRSDDPCKTVFIQKVGSRQRYLAGTYSLEFGTTPPIQVDNVKVGDKRIVPVSIPEPGTLNLKTGTRGYGGIFLRGESGLDLVVPFSGEDPSGRFSLQPGRYVVMFRAKHASRTDLSLTRSVDIRPGAIHTIEF